MKTFENEVLNIAHRGASGHAPENTMAAFERAVERNADGFEFDVQLTKDGVPIIFHDDTLNRTTDGKGKVSEHSVDDIRQLDAGSWFAKEFTGEKVPLLDELLHYAKDQFLLNIEIKVTPYPKELVEKVANAVFKNDIMDQCLVTSFDVAAINWAIKLLPDCRVGLLFKKETTSVWEGRWNFVAARSNLITTAFVEKAKQYQKQLVVWTVNEHKKMQELLELGAGRIITNYPDRFPKPYN